jgi:hypothetical protein
MKKIEVQLDKYKGYKTEQDNDLISIELEVGFDPGTVERRKIWEFLKNNSLVTEGIYPTNPAILKAIVKYFKEKYPEMEEFSLDGGGIEANIPPMCLELHKEIAQQKLILNYLNELKEFGFSDEVLSAGIHLNLDYNMLGNNQKEKQKTIKNLCLFTYQNIDFMVNMSQRKRGAQRLADMYSFLGDVCNQNGSEENFTEFLIHKNFLIDFFSTDSAYDSHLSVFNLHVGKKGRKALEIRWFGPTLDLFKYYVILEFGHSLIIFCKTTDKKLTEENFKSFITQNSNKYSNLFEYFKLPLKQENNGRSRSNN